MEVLTAEVTGLSEVLKEVSDTRRIDAMISRKEAILGKARELREVNPMLGHRGVRLGITFPEIYRMQIRAVIEAAARCEEEGVEVHAEIMVPQVCTAQELKLVHGYLDEVLSEVGRQRAESGVSVAFGTMPVARTTMSRPAIGTSWPSSASSTVTVRSAPTEFTLPFMKTMPSSWAWR